VNTQSLWEKTFIVKGFNSVLESDRNISENYRTKILDVSNSVSRVEKAA